MVTNANFAADGFLEISEQDWRKLQLTYPRRDDSDVEEENAAAQCGLGDL